jgi:Protein kinase domain
MSPGPERNEVRHYIKILEWIEPFARKVCALPGDDWAKALFDDITANGRMITTIDQPPNAEGPRIGLCGDTFFCEAVIDKNRPDSIFVSRVEKADDRLPTSIPEKRTGTYFLLGGGRFASEKLDAVAYLFPKAPSAPPRPPAPEAIDRSKGKASALLRQTLKDAPVELCDAWRPTAARTDDALSPAARLDALLVPWSRFGLSRFTRLPPRASMILNRQLAPDILSDAELNGLLRAFDVDLLNVFVTREKAHAYPLLTDIAGLPLAPDVRATIWCGMLAGRSAIDVRRALHDSAAELAQLAKRADGALTWTDAILATMVIVGETQGDQDLVERSRSARDTADSIESITEWAAQLQFQQEEPLPDSVADIGADSRAERGPTTTSAARETTPPALPVVDRWVLRLGLPDRDFAKDLESEVGAPLAAISKFTETASSVAGLTRLLESLHELPQQLHGWSQRLPDPSLLSALHAEALAAHNEAKDLLGEDVGTLLERTPTPTEVRDIVRILRRKEVLSHFPPWLRPRGDGAATDVGSWAVWLCDAETRSQTAALLAAADELSPQDISLLAFVPKPTELGEIEVHLRAALQPMVALEQSMRELSGEHSTWVRECLATGEDKASILRSAEALETLRARLSDAAFRAVIANATSAATPTEREQRVYVYGTAVRFFEDQVGSGADPTIDQLDKWIVRQGAGAARPGGAATFMHWELSVAHGAFDGDGARAPISFQSVQGRPYGRVLVPLVIETSRRGDYSLRLKIEARTKGRQGWSSDWAQPSPADVVVPRDEWRDIGQQRFVFPLCIDVPTRAPASATESLELDVTICDPAGTALSEVKRLKWDAIEPAFKPISLAWPEGVTTSYVDAHPIGPQRKMQLIVRRVEAGSSFAIVAPRRFGKSTLVDYLEKHLNEIGFVAPPAVVCTSYDAPQGFDFDSLFRDVADRLADMVGVGLVGRIEDGVPQPDAFDFVRRAAHKAGKRGVVLLFDEAQLFFSKANGTFIGDRLKDRLERHWRTPATNDMVPVLFGFVGLPKLVDKAGANLCGLLRPIEAKEIDEADLNRLLLTVTNGHLASTREARFKLIEIAQNLFLVRTLVENIIDRVNQQGRRWTTYDDVAAVEFDLCRGLRDGGEQDVGQLLRDTFNDAETINEWRPSRTFPIALALAEVCRRGGPKGETVVSRARAQLSTWCAELNTASAAQLSIDEASLNEQIAKLREDGVLDKLAFRWPLIESWLLGQVRNGYPPSAHDALIKAAYVTIRTPQGAAPIGEGGEAKVLRFNDGGVVKAMRRVTLSDENARSRFLQASSTLTILAEGDYRNEPGAQYIFELEAVGFSAESRMTAVQIYRWIDGCDLGEKVGTLEPPLVADIGHRLALALRILHARHIVHRDVQPKNVILSQFDKRPVLIDFGMARLESSPMVTALPSEFSAPEVRGSSPVWTRAADVYGLGKTLLSLLREPRASARELDEFLATCVEDDPNRRPDAATVAERLGELGEKLQVEQRRRAFWEGVLKRAAPDRGCAWFNEVLIKFQPRFEFLSLGIHRDELERSADLADFLNQVLEAFPIRGTQRLTLGSVKRSNDFTGTDLAVESIEFLHRARGWLSHGPKKVRDKEHFLAQLHHPSPEKMRTFVSDGAERIQRRLSLTTLSTIVTAVYDA